jgi:hypothetical protein
VKGNILIRARPTSSRIRVYTQWPTHRRVTEAATHGRATRMAAIGGNTTSLCGVWPTFVDCAAAHVILCSFCVVVDERDISMDGTLLRELQACKRCSSRGTTPLCSHSCARIFLYFGTFSGKKISRLDPRNI